LWEFFAERVELEPWRGGIVPVEVEVDEEETGEISRVDVEDTAEIRRVNP
jgi:hypothetical protein